MTLIDAELITVAPSSSVGFYSAPAGAHGAQVGLASYRGGQWVALADQVHPAVRLVALAPGERFRINALWALSYEDTAELRAFCLLEIGLHQVLREA